MNGQFQKIAINKPRSNRFDLSHEKKLSCNMGDLIPIYTQDVLPGDKFKLSSEIFLRMAPMLAPVMHRVNVFTHFFFVPNRLTWNEWEPFITGGEDGQQMPVYPKLFISESRKANYVKGTLADYFGMPIPPATAITQTLEVSSLPFRAYATIFNEYYRDQNVSDKLEFGLGSDTSADFAVISKLRSRAWEKDYFTSALPFAQRGGDVNLPVTSSFTPQYKAISEIFDDQGAPAGTGGTLGTQNLGSAPNLFITGASPGGLGRMENLVSPQDVTSTSVTIEELRRAVRLQEWLEKNARGGSRYTEQILAHFGVRSSDARLQRPEYLGGGKQPVIISEVLQTSNEATSTTPLAEMAGHGISIGRNNSFSRTFEEHGFIIGIMSVLPRTTYQEGVNKMWLKFDKFDIAWPEFSQLGEQEVKQQELYHDYSGAVNQGQGTFGYQSRYAEYKYKESTVHGDFRDNLAFWHMGRIFGTDPALNEQFVKSDPTHRIFAVTDPNIDKLYIQIYNKVSAIRPLPLYNIPKL